MRGIGDGNPLLLHLEQAKTERKEIGIVPEQAIDKTHKTPLSRSATAGAMLPFRARIVSSSTAAQASSFESSRLGLAMTGAETNARRAKIVVRSIASAALVMGELKKAQLSEELNVVDAKLCVLRDHCIVGPALRSQVHHGPSVN
ncbi:hypothetical protein Hypma_004963 [Hypsizygus marmoreus]|uniref:Uncharacterized protein n=1 Tax=Hypsizygus marmoreus TaxID=39966 RepID=A0A369K0M2_HYPMA|nr:hypothetical protein Hypma_004963 [Hypsizygus marmoreus]